MRLARRDFLRGAASGAALLGLPRVTAAETRLAPADASIDPLVRLIEDTPRDRLLEEMGARIRKGLSYRETVGALLLAAVRNVQPRPVGFKFHAVLAIHSAHQASQAAPDRDRWLPIFWGLDYFKSSQAEERQKTGWKLGPVNESSVPAAGKAKAAFLDAMDRWDLEAADGAAAALARNFGANDVFESFARVGPRDFRDIGHKVIYVAGAFRLLQAVGWNHAEPVLRSLALALNYHTGENPSKADHAADRPGRSNRERISKVRAGWIEGKIDDHAASDLYAAFRTAGDEDAAAKTVELLNAGVSPASLWDAILTAGGEILMRRANILSLHALTTMNAMRHCFETAASDETRRFILLQAAAFVPHFRGKLDREVKLDELPPAEGSPTVEDIFADVGKDNLSASRKALAFRKAGGDPKAVIDMARLLIFSKGRDAHDYKFNSAVLEDVEHLTPGWRDRYLAASLHYLKGTNSPDSGLLGRVRAALKG